jgi:predicted nucleic acid-binding protein
MSDPLIFDTSVWIDLLRYRSLRKKGLTIRKSNDCLIAFYAIEFSIPLVHLDNDFDLISSHSKLKTWQSRN